MRGGSQTESDPASLLAAVAGGMGRLVKGELALAKAEAQQAISTAGAGLVKAVVAAILAMVGLNTLAGAAIGALVGNGMSAGAAGLVVALVLLAAALILAVSAVSALKVRGLFPRRALRGLQQDAQAVKDGLGRKETTHVQTNV